MKNLITLIAGILWSLASMAQDVVQGEYFIDTDLGFGNNTLVSFTPAPDGTFPIPVDLTGIEPGVHKLYLRTRDSDGKWSFTLRRNVEVPAPYSKTTIVAGEYFIDTDPGFGKGSPVAVGSPDSVILQNFDVASAPLSEGYHKLYGRFLDNYGRWSQTFRRNIEVFKNDDNKVFKVEYFFTTDLGYGACSSVIFATPATDGSFSFDIPRNSIPSGADSLFVRVQNDNNGRWSITALKNMSVALPLTLLNFNVVNEGRSAVLKWYTTDEKNTDHFTIQRSVDGIQFSAIGKVQAKSLAGVENTYTYSDELSGLNAGIVYYRLQMVDRDGKYSYSNVEHVNNEGNGTQIRLYPNPAHSYVIVGNYGRTDLSNAAIVVADVSGRILISQKFTNSPEQRVNVSSLAKGVYLVRIVNNGTTQTKKLIIE